MITYTLKIPEMSNSKVDDLMIRWENSRSNFIEKHLLIALSRHLEIPLIDVNIGILISLDNDFVIENCPHHDDSYVKFDGITILTFRQNGLTLEAIHED